MFVKKLKLKPLGYRVLFCKASVTFVVEEVEIVIDSGWLRFCLFVSFLSMQVVEMYSSGGDLHLELPTGQQGGTKQLWVSAHVVPP